MNLKKTFTLITLCTISSYTYAMDKNSQEIVECELTTIYTTRDYNQRTPNNTNKSHNSDCIITINTFEHQNNTLENFNHNTSYSYEKISPILFQSITKEKKIILANERTALQITIEQNNIENNTLKAKTQRLLYKYGTGACCIIITLGTFIITPMLLAAIVDPCNYNTTLHCLEW